jgi:hypothetical protein
MEHYEEKKMNQGIPGELNIRNILEDKDFDKNAEKYFGSPEKAKKYFENYIAALNVFYPELVSKCVFFTSILSLKK